MLSTFNFQSSKLLFQGNIKTFLDNLNQPFPNTAKMWSAWWIEVPLSEKIHKDYNVTSNHTDIALLELEKSVY